MFLEPNGSISIQWLSRSVNWWNPTFEGVVVPESLRGQIISDIAGATGRTVQSDPNS